MVVVVDDSNSDEGKKFKVACGDFKHINTNIDMCRFFKNVFASLYF